MKKLILLLSVLFVVSCSKDPIIYTLTTSANPSEGGTVSPTTKQYEEGETATITATPAAEYVFQSWSGATGSSSSTSLVMSSDKSVTANFVKKKYTLTTSVEGEGTITEKIIKAGAATDYNSGTIVELTATPSAEWLFVEWKGDLTGTDNPKQITIDKAKTVKAVFVKKQYALTIEIEGEGTVAEKVIKTGAATDYNSGTVVELTATPSDGWELKEWTGDLTGTENPIQITIDKAKTVKAVFSRIEYTLSIDFKGNGSAKIYLEKENQTDSISVIEKTDLKYFSGDKLKIKAVPDEGWSFNFFSQDLSSSINPVEFEIDSNKSTTIGFEYTMPVVDADGNSYNVVTIPSYDSQGNFIKDVIWTKENFKGLRSKDDSMKVYELDGTNEKGKEGWFEEFDFLSGSANNNNLKMNNTQLFKDFQEDDLGIVKLKGEFFNAVFYRKNLSDLIIPEGWRIATLEDYQGLINYTQKVFSSNSSASANVNSIRYNGDSIGQTNATGFSAPEYGYISGVNVSCSNDSYRFPYKWMPRTNRFWTGNGDATFYLGRPRICDQGGSIWFMLKKGLDPKNANSIRLVKED
tara:strand:- start:2855 stop:4588 length:1734 start_codon:yes stop_codon:yes gene_type:complete